MTAICANCDRPHSEHQNALAARGINCPPPHAGTYRRAADPAPSREPTAESGEPREPHDVRYFVEALFEAASDVGPAHGLDTKLLAAAHLLNHYAEQARAAAAPPGAPSARETGSMLVALVRCIHGAVAAGQITPALRQQVTRLAATCDADLASRLTEALVLCAPDPDAPRLVQSASLASSQRVEAAAREHIKASDDIKAWWDDPTAPNADGRELSRELERTREALRTALSAAPPTTTRT